MSNLRACTQPLLDFFRWPTASLRTFCDMRPHVSLSLRRCFKSPVSRHFRRSNVTANNISKSEWTKTVEYAYNFWKCAYAVYPKLSKSAHAWRNYSLPKLAHFSDTVYRLHYTNNMKASSQKHAYHMLSWSNKNSLGNTFTIITSTNA